MAEHSFDLQDAADALAVLGDTWDALAERAGTPFLTSAWLRAWWEAYGQGTPVVATLRGPGGELVAGATLWTGRLGGLHATADAHGADWGIVGDPSAAAGLWTRLAELPHPTVTLAALADGPQAAAAAAALEAAGRRVHRAEGIASPVATLPSTFDELLASRSKNLRSQVGRRERALAKQGELRLRTLRGGDALGPALDAFLRVEASGWKADAGTAILADPRAERLYRAFARDAAERDWLRLHVLELDGEVIAGDLSCRLDGTEFLVKTGFDEAHSSSSPGLVLRAGVLRTAIDEGVTRYDFLGGPDAYKLRWTDDLRARVTLRGFRGARSAPAEAWWRAARPALAAARRELRPRAARLVERVRA